MTTNIYCIIYTYQQQMLENIISKRDVIYYSTNKVKHLEINLKMTHIIYEENYET